MAACTPEVEFHIRQNTPWNSLPNAIKEVCSVPISEVNVIYSHFYAVLGEKPISIR